MKVETIYELMKSGDLTESQLRAYFSLLMDAIPETINPIKGVILKRILKKEV